MYPRVISFSMFTSLTARLQSFLDACIVSPHNLRISVCLTSYIAALMIAAHAASAAHLIKDRARGIDETPPPLVFKRDLGVCNPVGSEAWNIAVLITNHASEAIELDKVVEDCRGCTRVSGIPLRLEPGQSKTLSVRVVPGVRRGHARFGATLLAGELLWARIEISALIPGIDLAGTESVYLGVMSATTPSDGARDTVQNKAPERGPAPPDEVGSARTFDIDLINVVGVDLSVVADDSRFTFEVSPPKFVASLGDGVPFRRSRVAVLARCRDAQAAPGHANDPCRSTVTIEMRLGGECIDRRTISISADHDTTLEPNPARLFFGGVTCPSTVEREITLPFQAQHVSVEGSGCTLLSTQVVGNGTRCRVSFALGERSRSFVQRGTLLLRAGDKLASVPWLGFLGGAVTEARNFDVPPPRANAADTIELNRLADALRAHAATTGAPTNADEYFALLAASTLVHAEPGNVELNVQLTQMTRWLSSVRESTAPADFPRVDDLIEILEYKRDLIVESDSAISRTLFVAKELVRTNVPDAQLKDVRAWSLTRRVHAGNLRITARATLTGQPPTDSVHAVVSDGVEEVISTQSGKFDRHAQLNYSAHEKTAEWESLAAMLGSRKQGTAPSEFDDLASMLRNENTVFVSRDETTMEGHPLWRLDFGFGQSQSIWLDPGLGLAVVRRASRGSAGGVQDTNICQAEDFFATDVGIMMPRTCIIQQFRHPLAADPSSEPRLVYEEVLRCVEYACSSHISPRGQSIEEIFASEMKRTRDLCASARFEESQQSMIPPKSTATLATMPSTETHP